MRTAEIGLPNPDTDPQFYDGVPARRAVAWVIDTVAILLISMVLIPILGVATLGLGFFFVPVMFLMIGFGYRAGFLTARSATPGLALMGIELRTASGERFEAIEAVLHTLGYTLVIASIVGQMASCILALVTPKGQSIPDLVLGTAAINRPL